MLDECDLINFQVEPPAPLARSLGEGRAAVCEFVSGGGGYLGICGGAFLAASQLRLEPGTRECTKAPIPR